MQSRQRSSSRRRSILYPTRRKVGIVLVVAGVALSLDQIMRFGHWDWWQMPLPWHHEGLAMVDVIGGSILLSPRKKPRPSGART